MNWPAAWKESFDHVVAQGKSETMARAFSDWCVYGAYQGESVGDAYERYIQLICSGCGCDVGECDCSSGRPRIHYE